jgi:hypothetical protein
MRVASVGIASQRKTIMMRATQLSLSSKQSQRRFATHSRVSRAAAAAAGSSDASKAAKGGKGASETLEFQAETRKLLDIVANALYTEKEGWLVGCCC